MTEARYKGPLLYPIPVEDCGGRVSRYFLDSEFTDFRHCELISVAVVGENGQEFYGERTDFNLELCNDFVRLAVLPQLGRFEGRAMPSAMLRQALRAWLNDIPREGTPVLCYDYETDLNLLRFLLNAPLPQGWRLQNIANQRDWGRRAVWFARYGGEHHALHDARANAYSFRA